MAQTFNFPDCRKGTTLSAVDFVTTINGIPANIVGVRAHFIKSHNKKIEEEREIISGAGITITDGPNGMFRTDAQIITWSAGVYDYVIYITLSNGYVKAYTTGKITIL